MLASLNGLSGLSLGQVALALGVAKSSVQAACTSKEELQLAAIREASAIFMARVITPALARPAGRERLWALVDNWLGYVKARALPGGCFMCATLADLDSHPGVVREALVRMHDGWLGLLAREIAAGQREGEIAASLAPAPLAFEIDALLAAANIARNLRDDDGPLAVARMVIAARLDASAGPAAHLAGHGEGR